MTSLRSELPDDLQSCHALIAQLQAELQAATEQLAKLQAATDETQDATEHVAHLEALLFLRTSERT
jgi:chaperonin cofactor prefoldin